MQGDAERPHSKSLLYYITDRAAFSADETTRRRRLLQKIAEAASAGVDYIQLREKDLPGRELESLAREAVRILEGMRTALLINSRSDVALASGAAGVHLRSDDISPKEVKGIWQDCGADVAARESRNEPPIAVSCHSVEEAQRAADGGATFAVFGPVFEKKDIPTVVPAGLNQLREACKARIPVLALGGITLSNARQCLEAGASGIAAIRLFQENEVGEIARWLRTDPAWTQLPPSDGDESR